MGLYDKPYKGSSVTDLAAGDAGALLRALSRVRMHFLYLAEKVQDNVRVQKDTEEAEGAAASTVVLQQAEAEREHKRVSRGSAVHGLLCRPGRDRTALCTGDAAPQTETKHKRISVCRCLQQGPWAAAQRGSGGGQGTLCRGVLKPARCTPCMCCACGHCGRAWHVVKVKARQFPHMLRGKQRPACRCWQHAVHAVRKTRPVAAHCSVAVLVIEDQSLELASTQVRLQFAYRCPDQVLALKYLQATPQASFGTCLPLLLQVQTVGLHSLSQQELQLRSTVAKLVNTEETYEVTSPCMTCLTSA